jgi:LacI family transcriptional regulator
LEKRATIKDIASRAGVSLGSVHCALLGKEGVSAETRQRIVNIAKEINYRPNASAAALKRKQLRIAAVFPGNTEDNRYYYAAVWQGIRDFFNTTGDMNIKCIEVPYYNGSNNYVDEIAELMDHTEISGLLSMGHLDNRGQVSLNRLIDKKIPVVLLTVDIPLSGRLCCVQPEYRISGRMMAEFITRQIPADAGILIFAGDVLLPSHYSIVEGFDSYLADKGLNNPVYKVHASGEKETDQARLLRTLRQKAPAACFCVYARGSVLLGNAVREAGLVGKITAVGSDLFEENFRFLQEGVFTNLLQKNPYMQAYVAAKCLSDYLLKDIRPPTDIIHVGSEIVFQSNASMFKSGFTQLLL